MRTGSDSCGGGCLMSRRSAEFPGTFLVHFVARSSAGKRLFETRHKAIRGGSAATSMSPTVSKSRFPALDLTVGVNDAVRSCDFTALALRWLERLLAGWIQGARQSSRLAFARRFDASVRHSLRTLGKSLFCHAQSQSSPATRYRSVCPPRLRPATEGRLPNSAVGSIVRLAAGGRDFETVGDMDVAAEPPWMASRRVSKSLPPAANRTTKHQTRQAQPRTHRQVDVPLR